LAAGDLIEIDKVRRSFDGGATLAVCDVSINVPAGAFVAVIGASGSGKTTTLKMVNRLTDPDAGEVRVEGRPVRASPPAELRRKIGYVFQGVGLFPHFSVAENIGITPKLLGWPSSEIAARTAELLDLVGLPQAYADRSPDALSGGERQRVGVARALAARPRIVLMDEPFGALDQVTRDQLATAYRALHDRLGLTTLMVTHDVQEAILLADRIVVMKAGRVLVDNEPRALLAGGSSDPDVAALMDMPRRQAERVRALMGDEAERPGDG
jgi:osmoprotectant transport system ATP-binding protein